MKKLLLLFAAFLIGLAQMQAATLYLCGGFNTSNTNAWNTDYKADNFNGGGSESSAVTINDVPIGTNTFQINIDWGSRDFYSAKTAIQQNVFVKCDRVAQNTSDYTISNQTGNNMTIAGATANQKFNITVYENNGAVYLKAVPVGGGGSSYPSTMTMHCYDHPKADKTCTADASKPGIYTFTLQDETQESGKGAAIWYRFEDSNGKKYNGSGSDNITVSPSTSGDSKTLIENSAEKNYTFTPDYDNYTYEVTVNIATSPMTMTIKSIEKGGSSNTKTPPTALWVGGDVEGSSWSDNMDNGVSLTPNADGTIFTGTFTTTNNGGNSYFNFFSELGKGKDNKSVRLDATDSNETLQVNAANQSAKKHTVNYAPGTGNSWKTSVGKTYDVTVDFTDPDNAQMWVWEHVEVADPNKDKGVYLSDGNYTWTYDAANGTYTATGVTLTKDKQYGIKYTGQDNWYTVNTGATSGFNGSTNESVTDFANGTYAVQGGNFKFTADQSNVTISVKFVDGTPNSITFSGLTTGGVTPPGPTPTGDFTIYFFDKKGNLTQNGECKTDLTVKVHAWDGVGGFYSWNSAEEAMAPITDSKHYVMIGETFYPVWRYTFSKINGRTPLKVIVYYCDATGKVVEQYDAENFGNGAFYTNDGDPTTQTLVAKIDDLSKMLYYHLKSDGIKHFGFDKNTEIEVEVAAYETASNNKWTDGNAKGLASSGGNQLPWTKMSLVNAEYQVYGANIAAAKKFSGDNLCVVFRYKKANGDYEYWDSYHFQSNGTYDNKGVNICDYIWTTSNNNEDQGAIQSYLTYADFEEAALADHQYLYMMGENGANFNHGDDYSESTNITGYTFTPGNKIKAYSLDKDCFYFQTTFNNKRFKLSYIDVYSYEEKHPHGLDTYRSKRQWASYDLGAIGLNLHNLPAGLVNTRPVDGNTCATVQVNKIIPIANYNQYDWEVNNTSNANYYIIVDMHPGCRSMTFLTFNPNPTAVIENGQPQDDVVVESDEDFAAIWYDQHLHACDYNNLDGDTHAEYRHINKIENKVYYKPSAGVKSAGFKLNYTVEDEFGNPLVDYRETFMNASEAADFNFPFLSGPFAKGKTYSTICWYHDDATGFNAHSRHGAATEGENSVNFLKPEADLSCKWVWQVNTADPKKHRISLGLLIEGMETYSGTTPNTKNYADYRVFLNGEEYPAHILSNRDCHNRFGDVEVPYDAKTSSASTVASINEGKRDYSAFLDNDNFNDNLSDHPEHWSYYITAAHNPDNDKHHKVALFVPLQEDLFYYGVDYAKYLKETYGSNVKIELSAVYPFLVPSNRVVAAGAENAPRRVSSLFSGNEIQLTRTTNEMTDLPINDDDITTGLNSIVIDSASEAPVYYNLQGVKVEKPGKGLYIEVRGKESKKVLF